MFPRRELLSFIRSHQVLVASFLAASAILLLNLPATAYTYADAAGYHIPRAHYWIQNGTARHFYTDNFRQIEFPPNSSFIYAWQILITGRYDQLHLAQVFSVFFTALSIMAIARLGGHTRGGSFFAAILYLSLPGVVLQMYTPANDLITAFIGSVTVFFAMASVTAYRSENHNLVRRYFSYTGMSFGLLLGTKLTAVFFIPVMPIVAGYFLVTHFTQAKRVVLYFSIVCLVGFLLFGAYNYILNMIDFGNPIASAEAEQYALVERKASIQGGKDGEADDPLGNLIRYTYQIMDWRLIKPIPGADTLYAINNGFYLRLDKAFNLGITSVKHFNLEEFGKRELRVASVGFGPIGYALAILTPLVLVIILFKKEKNLPVIASGMLIFFSLGWAVSFSALIPWTSDKVRYFVIVLPLLLAALAPWIYSRRRIALVWVIPLLILGLWIAGSTTDENKALFARFQHDLEPWQVEVLVRIFPEDAKIGVVGPVEFVHILSYFPEYHFMPVSESEIFSSLENNELDGILIYDPEDDYRRLRLPLEHDQSLLIQDPRDLLVENLPLFGVRVIVEDDQVGLDFLHSGLIRRLGFDQVRVFLPTVGPIRDSVSIDLSMEFPVPPPQASQLRLDCEGKNLGLVVEDRTITTEIPYGTFDSTLPYQSCRLFIFAETFGREIRSDAIRLTLGINLGEE
jgi:hypothetical protein